jgi:hypothetical protein
VNPPFRGASQAPEIAQPVLPQPPSQPAPEPPPPQPQQRPGMAIVEAPGSGDPPGRPEPGPQHEPESEPGLGEDPAPSRPAPVHVPYARTGSPAEAVSVPPPRSAPRPSRSPFWAAVRSHLWLVAIVLVLVGAAGAAYWGLRVHQRIGETTLERGIAGREHTSTVRCVERQSNGAVWACGLVYNAESVCLIADVNPAGDWTTKPGVDLCTPRPSLTALLPAAISPDAVAADLRTQHSLDISRCAKIPAHKVRWACLVPGGSSTSCLELRVVPWTPWTTDSSTACEHIPALRKFVQKAQ